MAIRILLLADIHGNYPALTAVAGQLSPDSFDRIVNCGDALVYAPFANETMAWLEQHQVLSILGNTDRKVKKLLAGQTMPKPSKPEKRVMYTTTAAILAPRHRDSLSGWPESARLELSAEKSGGTALAIGLFHGSPSDREEFLFANTPAERFDQLAAASDCHVVVTGHSHSPYHHCRRGVHFINPGSVGRMFDGDPRASCATLTVSAAGIAVAHHRIAYDVAATVRAIAREGLPAIYGEMYRTGRKLN
jgi:putative phosphoesterase